MKGATRSRWQVAQAIEQVLQEGDITQDDARFLRWLLEHKACPLGSPDGRSAEYYVRLNDKQIRTLLLHCRHYRNPGRNGVQLVRFPVVKPAQDVKLDSIVRY